LTTLIAESWAEHIAEHRERSWIPPLPEKHWNWKLIFGGAVVLTTIGKFVSDADIWVTSDVLQTISDSQIENLRGDNLKLQAEVQKLRALASWREFDDASHDKLVAFIKTLPRRLL
jgi:hypothetical protein